MKKEVLKHFETVDKKLAKESTRLKCSEDLGPEVHSDLFKRMCRIIVGQQLSGSAARSIWNRFIELFPKKKPTAQAISDMSDGKLRESGISFAKIRALRDLSEKVLSKEIKLNTLRKRSPEEVREILLAVKGVGPWTVEMFLMFGLGQSDVFAPGDLGLRKGMQNIYKLKELPTQEEAAKRAEKWSPYRTYASLVLWKAADEHKRA